jgi:ribosomal protein S18 acetylase RimI-like enzyme
MSFRIANEGDAKQMKRCNESCLPENYPMELWKSVLQKNPDLSVLSLQNENRIRGYVLMVQDSQPECAVLFSLAVHHRYRQRGIGGELISRALAQVREKLPLVKRVRLQVRESSPAIRLYQKQGFARTDLLTGYYDDGENAWEMTKEL